MYLQVTTTYGSLIPGAEYIRKLVRRGAEPNPAVWNALLSLAKKEKFRSRVVPCFFGSSETEFGLHQKAEDGQCAVCDLMPNVMDQFGIWENSQARVNPDYYITADGRSGILVRHIEAGAPYSIWYSHWQGLNPAKGVGWQAFVMVIERIQRHLRDRIVWMRPSDIAGRYHAAGGWSDFSTRRSPPIQAERPGDEHSARARPQGDGAGLVVHRGHRL